MLLCLLDASRAGMDASARRTVERVTRVLVLGLPAHTVGTVLLALRHRRANHKHVTRAAMRLLLEHAEAAAERAEASWQSLAPGQALLADAGEDLGRASRDFRRRAERAVRDWQQGVLEMVRTEGADKRGTARFLAYGVNGLGVALMVVVFAHTGGALVGAEAGVAGGAAVLGQKLLEAVFGDQAVRRLAANARRDLHVRVTALMDQERQRFVDRLDVLELPVDSSEQLRVLARKVDDLRFATARSGS
jgi:hypothetical protein